MSEYVVPDHCTFCDEPPTCGFNDIVVCDAHVQEGIAEAVKVIALAREIRDPQRQAALKDALTHVFEEHADEMNTPGDSIEINTGYDPGAN
jgi:bacterioferritin (cytochrome b1)